MDEYEKTFLFGLRKINKDMFLSATKGKDPALQNVLQASLNTIDVIIDGFNIIEDMNIEQIEEVLKNFRG